MITGTGTRINDTRIRHNITTIHNETIIVGDIHIMNRTMREGA